jgi:hypothetical protein
VNLLTSGTAFLILYVAEFRHGGNITFCISYALRALIVQAALFEI